MADKAIRGLNAGAFVSPSAGSAFAMQNTNVSTAAVPTTFERMGQMIPVNQSFSTANVTATPGRLYVATITTLTDNRDFILPQANIGERVGLYITDGDADFAIVIKGDTGVTINDGTAATEWSRVFIKNEYVEFFYHATNKWIVTSDRRVPCQCKLYRNTNQTGATTGWTKVNVNASEYDVGGIGDPTTNNRIDIRRAARYQVIVSIAWDGLPADIRALAACYKEGSLAIQSPRWYNGLIVTGTPTASDTEAAAVGVLDCALDDTLELYANHNATPNQTIEGLQDRVFILVEEKLNP